MTDIRMTAFNRISLLRAAAIALVAIAPAAAHAQNPPRKVSGADSARIAQRRLRMADSMRARMGDSTRSRPMMDSLRKLRAAGVPMDSLRKLLPAGDSLRKRRAAGANVDSLRKARSGDALARPSGRGTGGGAGILADVQLTPEQESKVAEIREKYQKERAALLKGGKGAPQANGAKKPGRPARAQGQAVGQSNNTALERITELANRETAEIRTVLTKEQQVRFDANVAAIKARGANARKGRGGR